MKFYHGKHRATHQQNRNLGGDVWLGCGDGKLVCFPSEQTLAADFSMRIFREGGVCKTQNRVVEVLVIFMIVNGAIIFADGPVRRFGISLLVGLVVVIWYAKVRHRKHN